MFQTITDWFNPPSDSGKPMVQIKLQGGLGNQLFQMAYLYVIQRKFPEAIVGHSGVVRHGQPFFQTFFEQIPPLIFPREVKSCSHVEVSNVTTQIVPWFARPSLPAYLTLSGYFQNAQWYLPYRKSLTKLFLAWTLTETWRLRNVRIPDVAIHVRRGDYLVLSQVFTTLNTKYYDEAIRLLNKNDEMKTAWIFTDDSSWCNEMLIPVLKSWNIEVLNWKESLISGPEYECWYMSLAPRIIMANSTFSWWSAFFSSAKVVSPKRWFSHQNQKDHSATYSVPNWQLVDN